MLLTKSAFRSAILGICCLLITSCAEKPLNYDEVNTDVHRIFAEAERDNSTVNQAMQADQLEALGPAARPAIESYVQNKPPVIRTLALISLQRLMAKKNGRRFSPEDVNRYLNMFSESDVIVRTYAMEVLISAGKKYRPQILTFKKNASPEISSKLDIVLHEQK